MPFTWGWGAGAPSPRGARRGVHGCALTTICLLSRFGVAWLVFGVLVLFRFGSFLYMVWKLSDPIEQKTEEEGGPVHYPPWPGSRWPWRPGCAPGLAHAPPVGHHPDVGTGGVCRAGGGGPGWSRLEQPPHEGSSLWLQAQAWGGCWDHRGPGDRSGREGGPPGPGCLSEGSDLYWFWGEGGGPLCVCPGGLRALGGPQAALQV